LYRRFQAESFGFKKNGILILKIENYHHWQFSLFLVLSNLLNFTQNHINSTISGHKIFTTIWDYSQPPLHFKRLVWAHPSPMFVCFVAWARNKVWKFELLEVAQLWKIVNTTWEMGMRHSKSEKDDMTCPPYQRGFSFHPKTL
jgi:hypothetical protein